MARVTHKTYGKVSVISVQRGLGISIQVIGDFSVAHWRTFPLLANYSPSYASTYSADDRWTSRSLALRGIPPAFRGPRDDWLWSVFGHNSGWVSLMLSTSHTIPVPSRLWYLVGRATIEVAGDAGAGRECLIIPTNCTSTSGKNITSAYPQMQSGLVKGAAPPLF